MFEKEATEYALEWGDKTDGTYACCRDGYLVGAEFGYNKKCEETFEIALTQIKHDRAVVIEENERLHAKIAELEKENVELKDLIKNIIRVTWGEGWNYSLDWKVKAESI